MHDALVQLLGPDKVSTAEDVLATHATDKWHASSLPDTVVFAESTNDISQTLAFAHERGIPVTTRGAGVGYVGGCVPSEGGIALTVARMNKSGAFAGLAANQKERAADVLSLKGAKTRW